MTTLESTVSPVEDAVVIAASNVTYVTTGVPMPPAATAHEVTPGLPLPPSAAAHALPPSAAAHEISPMVGGNMPKGGEWVEVPRWRAKNISKHSNGAVTPSAIAAPLSPSPSTLICPMCPHTARLRAMGIAVQQ